MIEHDRFKPKWGVNNVCDFQDASRMTQLEKFSQSFKFDNYNIFQFSSFEAIFVSFWFNVNSSVLLSS